MDNEKENQSDQGDPELVVQPEEAAVIWSSKKGYRIFLPKWRDDEQMPIQAFSLVACAMRLTEEESFNVEMFEWYENKANQQNQESNLEN